MYVGFNLALFIFRPQLLRCKKDKYKTGYSIPCFGRFQDYFKTFFQFFKNFHYKIWKWFFSLETDKLEENVWIESELMIWWSVQHYTSIRQVAPSSSVATSWYVFWESADWSTYQILIKQQFFYFISIARLRLLAIWDVHSGNLIKIFHWFTI